MQIRTTTLGTIFVLALTAAPVAAQGKGNPEVADRIAVLRDAMKDRKMARDDEAVKVTGELAAMYGKALAADQKKIVRAVDASLTKGKLRPVTNVQVYQASAAALGNMGSDGARALQRAYDKKRFPNKPEWAAMRGDLLRQIGRTQDTRMVAFLCERAGRVNYDEELVAVGEALANYADFDQKVRKQIAKTMISKMGGIEGTAAIEVMRADTPQSLAVSAAKKTMAMIGDPWNATLRKVTGQDFSTSFDWQRWYNKNKSKNWDPPKGK